MKKIYFWLATSLLIPVLVAGKPMSSKEFTENKLLFLNAANFDFTGKLKVNYVGHINIFAPELGKKGTGLLGNCKGLLGINTGIMKLNYLDSDTSKTRELEENIALRPLYNKLGSGDKYRKEYNRYQYEISNTAWSLYIQPMLKLYSVGDESTGTSLFLHGHAELLIEKWKISTVKNNLDEDTATYDPLNPVYVHRLSENEVNTRIARLNGYFGGGLTVTLAPWENSSFFFQVTAGGTNKDNFVDWDSNKIPPNYLKSDNEWIGFYLFRAYYTQTVSEAATIVLGTDIRGYLPTYRPNYAIYLGLNLNVSEVANLLRS